MRFTAIAPASAIKLLAVLLSLAVFAPGQTTPQVSFNGDAVGPVPVAVSDFALQTIVGPASMPVAQVVDFAAVSVPTPFGTLGVDPASPTATFVLNGFVPGAFNHELSFLSAGTGGDPGSLTLFVRPFESFPAGLHFWTQVYAADPTHPEGGVLSNTLEVHSTSPPPLVSATTPNLSSVGGVLVVQGAYFDPDPAGNTVTVGGRMCDVMQATDSELRVVLPTDARSGSVMVGTSSGVGGGNIHDIHTWCAIITPYLTETQAASPTLHDTDRVTAVGELFLAGQKDHYTLWAETGEEIFVEVYSWDPSAQLVTGTSNLVNLGFDPVIRIKRENIILAQDDDSGPELNAAVGADSGATFFVADEAGPYTIEVDTYLNQGIGHYLLVMGTREPEELPLQIHGVYPNVAKEGNVVTLYASGVWADMDPADVTCTVGGKPAQVLQVLNGHLDIEVPAGCRSGQVDIAVDSEATSNYVNRMPSWLCVVSDRIYLENEALTALLQPGDTVSGVIDATGDSDIYVFEAEAGRSYMIECSAFDPALGRITTNIFPASSPVDPDVRITATGSTTPILAADGSGGPGTNALIGGTISAAFTPTVSGHYDITVLPWFGLSSGDYILNIWEL